MGLTNHSTGGFEDESEPESDPEDDEDNALDIEFPNLRHLRSPLLRCQAYQVFRHDLLHLVRPNFAERIKRLVADVRSPNHPLYSGALSTTAAASKPRCVARIG
ncbi:hypothetical protein BDW71DRAFT_170747 [Aspergillus fruticulosus]